jgi:predicted MPP superfamily phosphohydrolase
MTQNGRWSVDPADFTEKKGRLVPKKEGQTTIIHLSDLHFNSTTDWSKPPFSALVSDLEKLSDPPDLLVCTGDVIDSSVSDSLSRSRIEQALRAAREFLEELCKTSKLEPGEALFVIPGNHDCRVKGIFTHSVLKNLFLSCFGDYFRSRLLPGLNLLVCSFDSNSDDWTLNLATGFVEQQEFVDFQKWLTKCSKYEHFHELTKIALLHHHPMPIAETEKSGKLDPSQFMILRNAATFMTEVLDAGVDLVLHGHQHMIGYARGAFPFVDSIREVAVIAAGSAGEPNDGSYRSYNVVVVPGDGPIEVEQRVIREGLYRPRPRFFVPKDYGEWRRIRALRLAQLPEVFVRGDTMNTEVIIDSAGDSARSNLMTGLRSHGAEFRETIPALSFSAAANFGPATAVCLNDPNRAVGLTPTDGGRISNGVIRYELTFAPPLSSSDSLDIETRRAAFNSFFFYAQDRRDVLPRGETNGAPEVPSTEKVGWRSIGLFDSVCMTAKFPPNAACLAPRVEVTRSGKPEAIDRAESDYCSHRLSYRSSTATAHLTVDYPLPLHDYWIVWGLPEEPQAQYGAAAAGDIEAIEAVWAENASAVKARISSSLEKLRVEIAQRFSLNDPATEVDIALMHFDARAEARQLRTFAALYPAGDPLYSWSLRKGQGIEGQALRRRADLIGFENDGIWQHYYVRPKDSEKDWFVLASPLAYPLNSDRVVCVARLATRSGSSGLLRLQGDDAKQRELGELVHAHYIGAILPAVLKREKYALLKDGRIAYYSIEECLN